MECLDPFHFALARLFVPIPVIRFFFNIPKNVVAAICGLHSKIHSQNYALHDYYTIFCYFLNQW